MKVKVNLGSKKTAQTRKSTAAGTKTGVPHFDNKPPDRKQGSRAGFGQC
jgi:hypothetical protein